MKLPNKDRAKSAKDSLDKIKVQEIAVLNQLASIMKSERRIQIVLERFCILAPKAFRYPEDISIRIRYKSDTYINKTFEKSFDILTKSIPDDEDNELHFEINYSKPHPDSLLNIFVENEKAFFETLALELYKYLNPDAVADNSFSGRMRELAAINKVNRFLREKKPLRETFEQICTFLPSAFQHPIYAHVRITYGNREFVINGFKTSPWSICQKFTTIDNQNGMLEVFYEKELPDSDEGPFNENEHHLMDRLALMIVNHLNSIRSDTELSRTEPRPPVGPTSVINSRQLLQKFLNKNNYNRDIFHDLMPFKVREILLVANLYDAYNIEKEGRFSEHILGEYYQFNLSSVPRITGVSTWQDAMEWMRSKHFDMVILMMGVDKNSQIEISNKIRDAYPYMPIYLLLNNNNDIFKFEQSPQKIQAIDKVFVWNGDPNIFFAMIKQLEDRVNVENDTKKGLVRVILLVEDSAKYYSRYLPTLYSSVMEQTRLLFDDIETDELFKIQKLRARPKILHAATYEDAIDLFNRYKDNMLCLISDVRFFHEGVLDDFAGFKLVESVRNELKELPIIMQSSDPANRKPAYRLKTAFIDKNSESLVQDIKDFIALYLGFGPFIFRDKKGKFLFSAENLKEFEKLIRVVPDESLLYHSKRNHFSAWFMARGEVQIALILHPYRLSDFPNPSKVRKFLVLAIAKHRSEQNKGKIIPFEEARLEDSENIITLSSGSFGGKGRGVSFINTLIYNIGFEKLLPDINIRVPKTFIIGTDEFETFIEHNKLFYILNDSDISEEAIRKRFMKGKISDKLTNRITKLLEIFKKPMAIRSSGLFEDSLMQPFAGIFDTYLIPNSHPETEQRIHQCIDAIKMVYASVYSKKARDYVQAINYKIEEEKMAIVIQEVVGNSYDNKFYPNISGVAQSYNYYPFAHMKPEEGFAVAAVGLGSYVVEGKKAYRFSPAYPKLEINTPEDQLKVSQNELLAVDLNKHNFDLLQGEDAGLIRLSIKDAEQHGVLTHVASVFDYNNQMIYPGLRRSGPRIINFADILKHNFIPLARSIEIVLDVVKESMGCPVEIEFAVDLKKDADYKASFYLLQIKPLLGNAEDFNISELDLQRDDLLLKSMKSMGNGLIDNITDVLFVDPDTFDNKRTEQIADEIAQFNADFVKEKKNYLLIGPGRWGTRDRYIGIPVTWAKISNAKVIVETSLEGFPLDASSGSHFFHNVTSMNVGYLSLLHTSADEFINWDRLKEAKTVKTTEFCRHIRFENPMEIKMDGKKRIAIIHEKR